MSPVDSHTTDPLTETLVDSVSDPDGEATSEARSVGPEAVPRFLHGELIADRFVLGELLGRGGTAHVYAAHDMVTRQSVALKIRRPERLLDVRREAVLARRVTHPNVCRIFDVFLHQSDGRAAQIIAMERLRGESLERWLESGRPTTSEALDVVRQIARGLDAAHEAGVLHLDLKPANVVLEPMRSARTECRGHRAVLTDFGFSVPASAGEDAAGGTRGWLPPEATRGERPTRAWDVFAFGRLAERLLPPASLTADGRRALERCRADDPARRPTESLASIAESLRLRREFVGRWLLAAAIALLTALALAALLARGVPVAPAAPTPVVDEWPDEGSAP